MKRETVLVVAAHPDDEILGCGGTIARHIDAGDQVHLAILAEGATSRDTMRNLHAKMDELSALQAAAEEAAAALGATSVEFCGLPDNRLDSLALLDVVKVVEEFVDRYQPTTIYTHHAGDVNTWTHL